MAAIIALILETGPWNRDEFGLNQGQVDMDYSAWASETPVWWQ